MDISHGNIMWNVLLQFKSTRKLRGLSTGMHLGLHYLLICCTLLTSFSGRARDTRAQADGEPLAHETGLEDEADKVLGV